MNLDEEFTDMNFVSIACIDKNIIYLVTDHGILLKTNNGGDDWKILNDNKKQKFIKVSKMI